MWVLRRLRITLRTSHGCGGRAVTKDHSGTFRIWSVDNTQLAATLIRLAKHPRPSCARDLVRSLPVIRIICVAMAGDKLAVGLRGGHSSVNGAAVAWQRSCH